MSRPNVQISSAQSELDQCLKVRPPVLACDALKLCRLVTDVLNTRLPLFMQLHSSCCYSVLLYKQIY
jgi:hypothetical protein